MAIVTFIPSGKTTDVPDGTLLIEAARRAGLPVAASCGVLRVCAKCNLQVVKGAENLNDQSIYEKMLLRKERLPPSDRIGCLARVRGDCSVTATYW